MSKKQLLVIISLLSTIIVLLSVFTGLLMSRRYDFRKNKTVISQAAPMAEGANKPSDPVDAYNQPTEKWDVGVLTKDKVTAIDHTIQYEGNIKTIEEAEKELRFYGESQREKYDNPKIKEIEKRIEDSTGIFAVNLGEMDEETALDVERAVLSMYEKYPSLKGTLTNITLANLDTSKSGHLAITQVREYIFNQDLAKTPYVAKFEILLSAYSFLDRESLRKTCENGVAQGHWPKGMDISAIVAHELSHQVLNAYAMSKFKYDHPYYVTDENADAFSRYVTDELKVNQKIPRKVLDEAYENWEKSHMGKSYDDFCLEISGYASGIQDDGGVSYPETVAEALTDIYLNGENASDASKCIEYVLIK